MVKLGNVQGWVMVMWIVLANDDALVHKFILADLVIDELLTCVMLG